MGGVYGEFWLGWFSCGRFPVTKTNPNPTKTIFFCGEKVALFNLNFLKIVIIFRDKRGAYQNTPSKPVGVFAENLVGLVLLCSLFPVIKPIPTLEKYFFLREKVTQMPLLT